MVNNVCRSNSQWLIMYTGVIGTSNQFYLKQVMVFSRIANITVGLLNMILLDEEDKNIVTCKVTI